MMMATCVSYSFESELELIKDVVNDVLEYIKDQFPYISEEDLLELRIVYSELLINAIVHGNKQDLSKRVELTIEINQDEILSVIRDEGNGFNFSEIYAERNNYRNLFDECGRGLQLARSLTGYLRFNDKGNEVEFCKKI